MLKCLTVSPAGYLPKRIETRILKTYQLSCVRCSSFQNNQDVETNVSIHDRWIKKMYTHPVENLTFSLKDDDSVTCDNPDETQEHYVAFKILQCFPVRRG